MDKQITTLQEKYQKEVLEALESGKVRHIADYIIFDAINEAFLYGKEQGKFVLLVKSCSWG